MNHLTQSPSGLSADAYIVIRDLIVSGQITAGSSLSERTLSERLGISRTPIREAIRALVNEGLVEVVPMRGTFVCQLSVRDLSEINEVRHALEGMAAYLAAKKGASAALRGCAAVMEKMLSDDPLDVDQAQQAGWEFHDAVFLCADNERLATMYRSLRAQSGLALQRIKHYDAARSRQALQEHLEIYRAIEQGQAEQAQQAVWFHLSNAMEARLQVLSPGYESASTR